MNPSLQSVIRCAESIHPGVRVSPQWIQSVQSLPDSDRLLGHALQMLEAEKTQAYFQPRHYKKTVSQKDDFPYSHCRLLSQLLGQVYPTRVERDGRESRFMDLDDRQVDETVRQLRDDGLCVLPVQMRDKHLDEIRDALKAQEYINRMTKQVRRGVDEQIEGLHGAWWIKDEAGLAASDILQQLAFDPLLLEIVQGGLDTIPIHVQTNAWWTFPQPPSNDADLEKSEKRNAQWFHQDMEFIDFVKVFVYLTDVGPNNGPHVYVAGSANDYEQRLPGVAVSSRVSDQDVEAAFGADRVKSITGPAGLIAIENTRGYHKGTPAIEGCRCILQLEYACSMYFNPVHAFDRDCLDNEHRRLMEKYPRMFMNYRDAAQEATRGWWPWSRRRAA